MEARGNTSLRWIIDNACSTLRIGSLYVLFVEFSLTDVLRFSAPPKIDEIPQVELLVFPDIINRCITCYDPNFAHQVQFTQRRKVRRQLPICYLNTSKTKEQREEGPPGITSIRTITRLINITFVFVLTVAIVSGK